VTASPDNWTEGDAYESYMGRWSRLLARSFIGWLQVPPGAHWLEVGCGTGALTSAICELGKPASLVACDPSASFVEHARRAHRDPRVSFVVADARALPGTPRAFDCVVSGLVLNFIGDPVAAVRMMSGRLRPGGVVGAYVWDYAEGMGFLRSFWDEAVTLDVSAVAYDEGRRFPVCRRDVLGAVFAEAGLSEVSAEGLEIPTEFDGFEDFWAPFLRGTGPAPAYVASLSHEGRDRLRGRLADGLKRDVGGRIRLKARAWAVRARCHHQAAQRGDEPDER
jgi:SAM-dependent methyltransferase